MDVGRIEATLTARFDNDPFERYDRALRDARQEGTRPVEATLRGDFDSAGFSKFDRELEGAQREARRGATARLDARADTAAMDRYRRSLNDVDGTTRRASQSTGGLKSSFMTLAGNAKMLAGGAAIAGVAIAARSMYEEMSEAETVGAQLDAVLKSTGGAANVTKAQVLALSEAVGRKAALDDEAVASGANLLLTFTKVRNEAGRGNDIFSQAVGLTADLSRSFGKDLNMSAIMLGKALNDPVAGVSALSRVGVQFTDQQKDQIAAMVESGDQLAAQKMIMRELETQVGGSAAAYGKTLPGAVDRARNAFNNLMEDLGNKVEPGLAVAAGAVEDLFTGKAFKSGGTLDSIFGPLVDAVGDLYAQWLPVFGQIKDAFSDVFGGMEGGEFVKDFRAIGSVVGAVLGAMGDVVRRVVPGVAQVFRGLFTVVRGVVRVIGGVLRGDWGRAWAGVKDIVSGALLAVWGAIRAVTAPIRAAVAAIFRPIGRIISSAWDAATDAVSSAVSAVVGVVRGAVGAARSAVRSVFSAAAGIFRAAWNTARAAVQAGVRAATAVVRAAVGGARSAARAVGSGIVNAFDVVRNIPTKVRSAVSSAISAVRNLAGTALSAGASVGRAVINGIGSGLSAAGSFIANIGSQIASWINASTPFGDTIKIGPVSVTLPALAQGGRVGPSMRGAQLFVAGEGGKDEWVISQEGDRSRNVGWAVEALETLTGRQVAFYKGGKGANLPKSVSKGVSRAQATLRRVAGAEWATYLRSELDGIQRDERSYGQVERELAFSEEEYFDENADGSITIDWAAVNQRLGEIDRLVELREKIITRIRKLIAWVDKTVPVLRQTINKLRQAGKPGKNDSDDAKKRREGYRSDAARYQGILDELVTARPDLVLDQEDSELDKMELGYERASLSESALSSGTRPADPGPENPEPDSSSPETVARLAAEQVAELTANRASLFSSFGQNFMGAGASITPLSALAGVRYLGGGQTDAGILAAAGGGGIYGVGVGVDGPGRTTDGAITITNNYAAPPPDPHTWSQSLAWEMRTAVS